MGKTFTRALVLSLAVSSLPLACGDDEEGDGGGGKGKGGSAGMTGGTAGDAGSGGTAGGAATGGTGAQGGAGGGGRGGTAGLGGTAGSAGTMPGGMGGADDGGMGGQGDMGGEGGGGPTMSLCEQAYCVVGAGAGCTDSSTCESDCLGYYGIDAACDPLLDTFLQCVITANDSDAFRCDTNKPVYDYASGICNTEWDAFSDCLP